MIKYILVICSILFITSCVSSPIPINTCPKTKIIGNLSTLTDKKTYLNAKRRCGEIYKNSPCLKKFEKTSSNSYRATCGGEN